MCMFFIFKMFEVIESYIIKCTCAHMCKYIQQRATHEDKYINNLNLSFLACLKEVQNVFKSII
jgi:hypothetical protein